MGLGASAESLVDTVLGAPSDVPALPNVATLTKQVTRVLGQNPGQATLQGTNTYIVGCGEQRILIDTSDGNSRWWPIVEKALAEVGARISEVIITHRHYDHVGGIPSVRSTFPEARLWKAPEPPLDDALPSSSSSVGFDGGLEAPATPSKAGASAPSPSSEPGSAQTASPPRTPTGAAAGARARPSPPPSRSPSQWSSPSRSPPPAEEEWRCVPRRRKNQVRRGPRCNCSGCVPEDCQPLSEGQAFHLEGGGTLHVLLTSGHTPDSVCVLLEPEAGSKDTAVLFTGDTVLGGRTAMFSDLSSYELSLRRLQGCLVGCPGGGALVCPGHGQEVPANQSVEYLGSMIRAQANREKAVAQILQAMPGCTSSELCNSMYDGMISATMAQELVQLHLEALEEQGRARRSRGLFGRTTWESLEAVD